MNGNTRRFRNKGNSGGLVMWSILALMTIPLIGLPWGEVRAQSIVAGEVEGRVLDEASRPIRGASVTLRNSRSGLQWTLRTRTDGVFTFTSVPGGIFEMRVEALGYRPLVVTGLGVTPGDRRDVPARLIAELPPLSQTDTLRLPAAGGGSPGLGLRANMETLANLPDRIRDVAGLLALSSWADREGGLEGLPASSTTLFADGEPFRPAQHPSLSGTGAPLGLLFPRIGLQSATVRSGLSDIEWSGASGGIVSLETRAPTAQASGELFGFWSGGPTWTNEVVGEGPALLSAWGGGTASVPLAEGSAPLSLSFEGGLVETPNLFWRNDYFTQKVLGEPAEPGTRTSGYASALVRTGWAVGETGQVTLRAGGSAFRNESDRSGIPQAGYGSDLPVEGTDGSVGALATFPINDEFNMEVRGSGSFSSRVWDQGLGGLPGALLIGDRASLGTNSVYPATMDRLDLALTPVVHFRSGPNRLKAGARLEYGSFDVDHADQAGGAFFFGSRRSLLAGEGATITLSGSAPAESFSIARATLFGQYQWTAFPGLDITTGISYINESLPLQDAEPALAWGELTGVANLVEANNGLSSLGGKAFFKWDVLGDGLTWLTGGMGVDQGPLDPTAVYEVLALDGSVEAGRSLGTGLNWANGGVPSSSSVLGTRLAMFGPKLKAPRTSRGSVGVSHTLSGSGVRLEVSGSFRRTESILRRSDLNQLLVPSGTDQDGRPLYGDLSILSGVLAADPGSNRRFPGYESVWALNSDGWSEYVGVSASVEAPLPGSGFFMVSYTWSETTDNWVGASQDGALAKLAPDLPVENWDEAVSDFDIPHKLTAMAMLPLPIPWGGAVTGFYSLRSDLPFTPMVASGLDANGDGSPFNDLAFIPASGSAIEALAQEWTCLDTGNGEFASRNGCRGDPVHTLDLRLTLGLPPVAGVSSALVVDGLNLTDRDMGIRDNNLLLLRSGSVNQASGGVEVPYKVNPGFGSWVYRGDTGRMVRIGIRIGGGQ